VDFTATAAAIAQLDIVLTIDTSVAHLAGALGKPTWVVLTFLSAGLPIFSTNFVNDRFQAQDFCRPNKFLP